MKQPITLILLLPILFLCFFLLGDNWGYGLVPLVILAFLLEIRIKKGNLSKQGIKEFFNTPMNPKGETEKEMLARKNLKYSFSPIGLLFCLLWLILAPIVGINLYGEYKDWNFPIEIETVLIMVYMIGLGILYKLFFIKPKEK